MTSKTTEYEPRFVKPPDGQPSSLIQKAFDTLDQQEFDPKWFTQQEALAVEKSEKHCIYIIDPFEGSAFEHLEKLGCRIYGPSCILSCFEAEKPLPRQTFPIFCTSMRGLIVCFSNIESAERERLMKMVNYMGGDVMKVLTEHVTHLVTCQVGSKKYIVATSNLKIPIMLPAWIDAVWEHSLIGRIHADNDDFKKKFSCKIFQGLSVSVSGLDSLERKRVQTALEDNGGVYSGEMRRDRTTHLITTEPKGQKYSFATKWKLYIVHPQWLHDSLHSGYSRDESLYLVDSNKTSTPTKDDQRLPSLVNMSSIMSNSMINITQVNETMNTTIVNKQDPSILENNNNTDKDELEGLELKSSDLLDGCKVYLSGFCGERLDKIRRYVNLSGGTRFSSLNDSITHIVVNGKIDASLMEEIRASSSTARVVSLVWLLDSQKEGRLLPEDGYSCMKPLEASPVIKKVQKRPVQSADETIALNASATEAVDNEMSDLLSQYITNNDDTTRMTTDDDVTRLDAEPADDVTTLDDDVTKLENDDTKLDSDVTKLDNDVTTLEADETINDGSVLGGRKVVIIGFEDEIVKELTMIVEDLGGRVISSKDRVVPYYALVPPFGCPVPMSVNEVVTSFWLQRCQEGQCLFNVNENVLFKPLTVKEAEPLVDCVIAITGFSGVERELLLEICAKLGAVVQEVFCKKANKKTKASTHLLASIPEGLASSKYEAAKMVNVPIVTKDWVITCARTGVRQNEADFEAKNPEEREEEDEDDEIILKANVPPIEEEDKSAKPITDDVKLRKNVESANDKATPSGRNSRVQELLATEKPTPVGTGVKDFSKMTPKTALENIEFDIGDLLSEFDTPASQKKKRRRKSSLPLEDLYNHHINIAVRRFEHPEEFQSPAPDTQASQDSEEEKPLSDVVIAVSKKISEKQASDYFNIVSKLGGDYRWVYDNSCTHYIHQGRSDHSKEFKTAREKGKFIVSPYWLIMCEQQKSRVDEDLFPANFDPNRSLSVTTPRPTPMTRRQTRKAQMHQDPGSSPVLESRPSDSSGSQTSKVQEDKVKPFKALDPPSVEMTVEKVEENTKTPELVQRGDSFEMQQVIQKELEDIMANSKTSLSNSAPKRSRSRRTNPDNQLTRSNRPVRTSSSTACNDENLSSQQGDVTWDDPSSRKEREKFVEVLRKPYSPTQHSESQFSEPLKLDFKAVELQAPVSVQSPLPVKEDDKPPPTPEAPSLIFPRPRMAISAPSPQPVDPPSVNTDDTANPIILLSGMSPQEKNNYGALIERLGGTLLESSTFDSRCTHLVAGQPTRNEKCLSSIASGKWILHKSWFEACREADTFVKEIDHEWGSTSTLAVKNPPTVVKLSEAAHRWRVKLQNKKRGAFHDWKVIICAPSNRIGGFKRLLEAGGATVLCTRPPFSTFLSVATHAFMDLVKSNVEVNLDEFVKAGIPCYKPEFIAGFLMDEFLDKDSYIISELNKDGNGKKRKGSEPSDSNKKSKLQ